MFNNHASTFSSKYPSKVGGMFFLNYPCNSSLDSLLHFILGDVYLEMLLSHVSS